MKRKAYFQKLLALGLILCLVCGLSACCGSDIPFNGEVTFHDIALTIPENYIRDSAQSTEDLWVFEKGFYSRYILLSRKNASGDAAASLDAYAAYLTEQGVQAQRTVFLDQEAVLSSWTNEGMFCQELLFAYGGSLYAISLRGGSQEDFEALLKTTELLAAQNSL